MHLSLTLVSRLLITSLSCAQLVLGLTRRSCWSIHLHSVHRSKEFRWIRIRQFFGRWIGRSSRIRQRYGHHRRSRTSLYLVYEPVSSSCARLIDCGKLDYSGHSIRFNPSSHESTIVAPPPPPTHHPPITPTPPLQPSNNLNLLEEEGQQIILPQHGKLRLEQDHQNHQRRIRDCLNRRGRRNKRCRDWREGEACWMMMRTTKGRN